MDVQAVLNKYYFAMTLETLRRVHSSGVLPHISFNSLLYLDMIDMLSPECTASGLAELLRVSRSAVTMKVRELENQGLVEKIRSAEDRRVQYLRINPAIVDEYNQYDRALTRSVRHIRSKFGKKDLAKFCEILEELSNEYVRDDVSG